MPTTHSRFGPLVIAALLGAAIPTLALSPVPSAAPPVVATVARQAVVLEVPDSQLDELKTILLADHAGQDDETAANNLNAPASPDFWVWRTSVSKDELTNSTSVDGTTFSWTGAGFITRSQGERDAWRELFNSQNRVNPSLDQVRTAMGDIFSGGTAPAPANRTHLLTIARRKATKFEKAVATGTGSTASPAKLTFEGSVTAQDVSEARNLP